MVTSNDLVDLSQWTRAEAEPSGENENWWFIAPDDSRWMFKANPIKRSSNVNSAELVASQIAPLVGIPAAEVRLAEYLGEIGCVSRNVKSHPRNQLTHAAVFISEYETDFDPKAKRGIGHSLENIAQLLSGTGAPIGREQQGRSASFWFAGYLVFDALIANQDRHSENWAIEIDAGGLPHLAPSYDHGTSLGIVNRNEDKLPGLLLSQERLAAFVGRARGNRFEGCAKVSLVDVAARFCNMIEPSAAIHWGQQVGALDLNKVDEIVASSKMSPPNDKLAIEIIRLNKERLLRCLFP